MVRTADIKPKIIDEAPLKSGSLREMYDSMKQNFHDWKREHGTKAEEMRLVLLGIGLGILGNWLSDSTFCIGGTQPLPFCMVMLAISGVGLAVISFFIYQNIKSETKHEKFLNFLEKNLTPEKLKQELEKFDEMKRKTQNIPQDTAISTGVNKEDVKVDEKGEHVVVEPVMQDIAAPKPENKDDLTKSV